MFLLICFLPLTPLDIFEVLPINLGCPSSLNPLIYLPGVPVAVLFFFIPLVWCGTILSYFVTAQKFIIINTIIKLIQFLEKTQSFTLGITFGKGVSFPHFCLIVVLMIFLGVFNLIGLIPFGMPITAHFSITLLYSSVFFVSFNLIGLIVHRDQFVGLWLPQGTPHFIIPFIIVVEFLSYTIRLFSLSVRLFANIMAGHSLVKILSTFSCSLLLTGGIFTYLGLLPLFAVFLLSAIEFMVALLQSYVFVTLLQIYLKDVISLLH